jgi:hypothetical protein
VGLPCRTRQIGTFQVAVRYAAPLVSWNGQSRFRLRLPLAVPADEEELLNSPGSRSSSLAEGQIEPDLADADDLLGPPHIPTVRCPRFPGRGRSR